MRGSAAAEIVWLDYGFGGEHLVAGNFVENVGADLISFRQVGESDC